MQFPYQDCNDMVDGLLICNVLKESFVSVVKATDLKSKSQQCQIVPVGFLDHDPQALTALLYFFSIVSCFG